MARPQISGEPTIVNQVHPRVLVSNREPRSTTNPYITMLTAALRRTSGVEIITFSYRAALLGRYDVVHLHWPETIVGQGGARRSGRIARGVLTSLFLLRLTIARTPVVRTMHNIELPADVSRAQRALLRWFDRLTTHRIVLNEQTVCPAPRTLIRHGHYRDWYTGRRSETVPGRLQYVGLIRRYKGVEGLVKAFRSVDDESLTLQIAGAPSSPELADTITRLSEDDQRISLHLGFLSDDELVSVVTAAELVVLPYRFMHNSGTILAALSLDRPVLAPDTPVNADLAAEVGPGWIHTFTGELTGEAIEAALQAARKHRAGKPDLSSREWADAGEAHRAVYRAALTGGRTSAPAAEVGR